MPLSMTRHLQLQGVFPYNSKRVSRTKEMDGYLENLAVH